MTRSLDDAAVDAVWRITAHPATLTREWYSQVVISGMDPIAFVELVGVVAMANALSYFCDAVGIEFPGAPPLVAGSSARPASGAEVTTHWVPTVESDLPNVRKALSAAPEELLLQGVLLDAMYVPGGALGRELDEDIWSLKRTQVELVASRTSTLNKCFY